MVKKLIFPSKEGRDSLKQRTPMHGTRIAFLREVSDPALASLYLCHSSCSSGWPLGPTCTSEVLPFVTTLAS